MNAQTATAIIMSIKDGVSVPKKTIYMVIGYLNSVAEKHKDKGDYVKAGEVNKAINYLKNLK